jgi:hypothetical protein
MDSSHSNNEILQIVGEYIAELVDQFMDARPDRKPRVTQEAIQAFAVVPSKELSNSCKLLKLKELLFNVLNTISFNLCISACNICLEEYTEKDGEEGIVRRLPCKHMFHNSCVTTWLDNSTNCPTCRFELPTDDAMFESFKKRKVTFVFP